jgi:hypothetical protein
MHSSTVYTLRLIFKLAVSTRLHAGRAELLRTEITLRFLLFVTLMLLGPVLLGYF